MHFVGFLRAPWLHAALAAEVPLAYLSYSLQNILHLLLLMHLTQVAGLDNGT